MTTTPTTRPPKVPQAPNPNPLRNCINCLGTGLGIAMKETCDCQSWATPADAAIAEKEAARWRQQNPTPRPRVAPATVSPTARRLQARPDRPMTEAQRRYLTDLRDQLPTGAARDAATSTLDSDPSRAAASAAIDNALNALRLHRLTEVSTGTPHSAPVAEEPMDLRGLPGGRYLVSRQEGDTVLTRTLEVDRPRRGTWRGWVFVRIPGGRNVGRQAPNETAARINPGHAVDVRALLADPHAAAVTYGRTTGRCAICGRRLTDPVSIAAGIGPICAARFGG